MRAFGLGNMESTNAAEEIILRVRIGDQHCRRHPASHSTPGFARQARNAVQDNGYQLQSATSSYAYEPQTVAMTSRRGQCWIATDASRPYGYMGTCANPLAYDPSLSPTYNSRTAWRISERLITRRGGPRSAPFRHWHLGSNHIFVMVSKSESGISIGTVAPVPVLNTDNSKAGTEKETKP